MSRFSDTLERGANFAARDPEHIRSMLPLMWLTTTLYFRGEVRGLERVPRDGPVLFVGNHSGGNISPDSVVFLLAYCTYFGVERPVYALAHSLVTAYPVLGRYLARWGVVRASPEHAKQALASGASVLVYPGGDVEVHRPYRDRHRIVFDHRSGFIRLAQEMGVPLVPVVASGGHDTYLPLADGHALAHFLKLDRFLRLHVLPISIALPWGLNVGDLLGHLPLPAKIRVEVLEPIDVRSRFPGDAGVERGYEYVTLRMQEALTALSGERLLPPLM